MRAGEVIASRYRLERLIGRGATGVVWAAHHEVLSRGCAIKIAKVVKADHQARFLREASIVGKLRHPNVVDVADAGTTDDGDFYLVMELLEGQSLADYLTANGPMNATKALEVAIDICRGLAAAHDAGVIHRDLKPANVFLAHATRGKVAKLLDFGVSKLASRDEGRVTSGNGICGTPAYMSPEHALGEELDPRADLWSLGVVLYEMVSGALPFQADVYEALLAQIVEEPYKPLADVVPIAVRTIVARCLTKKRDDRFASAAELEAALREALMVCRLSSGAPDPRLTSAVVEVSVDAPPERRFPSAWIAATLAGLALVIFASVWARSPSAASPSPPIVAAAMDSQRIAPPPAPPEPTIVPAAVASPPTSVSAASSARAPHGHPNDTTPKPKTRASSVTRVDNSGL